MSRPIGALLKEHAVLVAGIALPVLLIILFAVARMIPAETVADPTYEAVFAVNPSYNGYVFDVQDEKLVVTYTLNKDNYIAPNPEKTKILIYNGVTDDATTISLDVPKDAKEKTPVNIPVKELAEISLLKDEKAPDGYQYVREGWRNGSFVAEIFAYNSRHKPHSLVKDGRIIQISPLKNHYGNVVFLGWVKK